MQDSIHDARLRRRAAVAAGLCRGLAVALPLLVAAALWQTDATGSLARWLGFDPARLDPGAGHALAAVVAMVPVMLTAWALQSAARCFDAFADGRWFDREPAVALSAFGCRLIAASLAGILAPSLASLALSLDAPPGARAFAIRIGSTPVLAAIFGLLFWCLGDLWHRARRLADENAQFV